MPHRDRLEATRVTRSDRLRHLLDPRTGSTGRSKGRYLRVVAPGLALVASAAPAPRLAGPALRTKRRGSGGASARSPPARWLPKVLHSRVDQRLSRPLDRRRADPSIRG